MPYDEMNEEQDILDSEEGVQAASPLSAIMIARAREMSPRRQDIISRRDALLNAYKSLIAAQKYKPLPVRDPGMWISGASGLMESQDPNMRAFGAGEIARFKAMNDQNNQEAEALRNQAISQLKMDSEGLGFLDKDQQNEMDLLKQAASNDYRQQMLQMKLMLAAMRNNPASTAGATVASEAAAGVASEAGVPLYSGNDPYAGLDSVGKRQMRMSFEKQVQKLQEEAEANSAAIERMRRFEQLNELMKDKMLGPGPVTDYIPNWSDEMKEMESIAAEITPQMRVPGSGATSDFDARMFQKATVGTGKRYETNKNVATAYIANRQNQIDKSQFMEAYLNTNGHIRGAQQAWKKYLNENPIFDSQSKDFKLNERRKNWQEYFGISSSEESTNEKPGLEEDTIPPAPQGYDSEKWKKVYSKMTPEQKKLFGGKENAP